MTDNTMGKGKRTNNDVQNTTQKTKDDNKWYHRSNKYHYLPCTLLNKTKGVILVNYSYKN
jgi:hypothetical protein